MNGVDASLRREQFHESEENENDEFPPPYEVAATTVVVNSDAVDVHDDGRIDIDFDSKAGRSLGSLIPAPASDVVGSRGDVQPFIALGNELQTYGHRIRLATHPVFEELVTSASLEFYSIGGDSEQLMAYMVKNPGLIPSMTSLRNGEIQKKRLMISEMLSGCWKSCIEPDSVSQRPFVADAIIANPPSFAHIHCAQALGVPLHIMFTMPWTSTTAFSHPLTNIKASQIDTGLANYLSYGAVEWLTWQGLGDVVNKWRGTLDLEPIPAIKGPLLAESLKIPHTYCWSPSLVPAPSDWPGHIDVCGFFFRKPPQYSPSANLAAFLAAGPMPIYIGFGSIVVDDPEKLTAILLQAIESCNVRAIVSRGWSGLGGSSNPPKDVFYLDDCPYEWLFPQVSVVVHHGGAGTMACGLLNGRPTTVVPFFGDQRFWGDRVAAAGAGPEPIPYKLLDSQTLEQAIRFCLTPEALAAAESLGTQVRSESGVKAALASFHRNLPGETLSCDILPQSPAVWRYQKSKKQLRLSRPAAEALVQNSKVDPRNLSRYRPSPILIKNRRWDPLTASVSAAIGTATDMVTSTTSILRLPYDAYRRSAKNDATTGMTMLAASAQSLGRFNSAFFKGTMVDIPLAVTEGLRAAPRFYGEEVQDYGPVTDWKSGAKVAGKTFSHDFYDGLSGLVLQPYQGRKEGLLGLAKGIWKGTSGFVTKPAASIIGLVAYPGEGICKSFYTATHRRREKAITTALHAEGEYLMNSSPGRIDSTVLAAFDALFDQCDETA